MGVFGSNISHISPLAELDNLEELGLDPTRSLISVHWLGLPA